jgi:preprotein translocase subunit SecD
VATQEYKMKQANLKVRNQMNDLDVLASEYQNSGSRFQISAKDRQKRTDKIFELKKQA